MYGIKDFVPPVAGNYRITSGEGPRKSGRTTNGARMSSFHHGTDWAGATPGSKPDIQNITAGKVVWVGNAGGWGKTVIVQNPDGYTVQYGHLDSINVKVGDQVPAGAKIGVMGATGNVTGVHLDMIVTKNGKSIKRDGTVLADAPPSIARRAGQKQPSNSPSTHAEQPILVGDKPMVDKGGTMMKAAETIQPHTTPTNIGEELFGNIGNLFGGTPTNVLSGSVGVAVPDTRSENKLFGDIAGMGLDSSLESVYAEAAKGVLSAKDSISSKPMIQSDNPLRVELGHLFDSIEI